MDLFQAKVNILSNFGVQNVPTFTGCPTNVFITAYLRYVVCHHPEFIKQLEISAE